jgi:nitrogen fixation/metabolism regulation signal transduction histidine kinase
MSAARRARFSYETRLALLALVAGLPAVAAALMLAWTGPYSGPLRGALTAAAVLPWLGCAALLRERARRPLQTLSNLLAAVREGDFSLRLQSSKPDDALGEVFQEANALSRTLQEQRLGAVEATALLRSVMSESDVAVFTFDRENRLRLVNRAGAALLASAPEELLGRTAAELGLGHLLDGEPSSTLSWAFPGGSGRWGIRTSVFREHGLPHRLLVLSDLTRTLREEELQAWKRLVRVLGHELNNSLTPIRSIAGSLRGQLSRTPPAPDWQEDAARGLGIIESRAESLSRFLASYARLARLPAPQKQDVDVAAAVERVVRLERRMAARVAGGPAVTLRADRDQLDQLLINLLNNAVEASLETGGGVDVGWEVAGGRLAIWIDDEGPGLADTANLFVPFFTTKAQGSGIGLVLSRQSAEAHGGELTLENRRDARGCRAMLRLPL